MLTIGEKHMEWFNALLVDYYNTGDGGPVMSFLYDNAVRGMEI